MKWVVTVAIIAALSAAGIAVRSAAPAKAGNYDFFRPTATLTPPPIPHSPTPTPTPAVPAPPASLAALGPGVMTAECSSSSPGSARVVFLWTPSAAGAQYLDLSIYNNGFAPGTFVTAGGFDFVSYGYIWDGLRQGTTHFARVNTYTSAGWRESATLGFFTPVCDAAAIDPPPAPDMVALRDRIAGIIEDGPIDTAVAITDLRTGEVIDVAGDAPRLPGCTINLFALMRVVADLQDYRYPEPEPGDLIGQTINRSDPVTARRLVRDWLGGGDLFAGMQRVNDFVHALGMSHTLMDHPPAFPEDSFDEGAENRITALDVNTGLQALWDGRVLAPFWRDYLLSKMTLVKPGLNYLIPVGTSAGTTVSHKNGFLYEEGWADNDIGIVWHERGGERYGYAISFFTENVPNKYGDIPLGQQVSSLAYQWFVGRYGYP